MDDRLPIDDERWAPGMPALDRQVPRERPLPRSPRGWPPRSVPETRPTPLQAHYISLSAVALVCGTVAISALELGSGLGSPLVKLCVLVGAPLLALTTADNLLRVWRSAWAWMPLDRGRGLFRLAWAAADAVLLAALTIATGLVLLA
ncbi:MAG TPA: hypothetical protein VF763_00385 [Candidatus Limnocylindrales bacterium]